MMIPWNMFLSMNSMIEKKEKKNENNSCNNALCAWYCFWRMASNLVFKWLV